MGSSETLDQASPSWGLDGTSAHPALRQRTADAPTTRDREQAFDRLNPDYGVPSDPHNPYGRQALRDPGSRPLARHPCRRRQQPRERSQPGHVAGRPGLPGRRRHPYRPPRAGPEPTWSRTARLRTLNPARTPSSKEHC
jgi:hypothetical protein